MRMDFVFSYWIYAWYILYKLGITSYSPKFPLIIGLIDNLAMLFLMLSYGTTSRTIFYFIVINMLIKVVPLYDLKKETIQMKDVLACMVLFMAFLAWLHINQQNLMGNLKLIHDSLLYDGEKTTPFISLMQQIKANFSKMTIL
jgi:hypothetical protein